MKAPKLVLASSSTYRRHILQKLGIEFICDAPNIDETPHPTEAPAQLVLRLAEQKARKLATKFPNHLIIGSDQIATLDDTIIGKPGKHEAAIKQLTSFSGRSVKFITSICLHNSETGKSQQSIDSYTVKFRTLSTAQIESYLRKEQPYDCAGSFKSEGLGICLFETMEGKDPNTLIGLPLIELTRMLSNEGIDPLLA